MIELNFFQFTCVTLALIFMVACTGFEAFGRPVPRWLKAGTNPLAGIALGSLFIVFYNLLF